MPHILLIGCGKMGGALATAWVKHDPALILDIIDPNIPPAPLAQHVRTHATTIHMLKASLTYDAVVLAIKPQQMADVCANLHDRLPADTLVLSIAAGRETAGIARALSSSTQPIIRAMPNLPASIGHGISGAFATAHVTPSQRELGETLLSAAGPCVWVDDETMLDAVTALSGSGPAYVFLLTEILARAGESLGLPPTLATHLARATVTGSAALIEADEETSLGILRENVTSKGGTTEAALHILMHPETGIEPVFTRALTAARDRAKDLNQ
jgi:pyrroline-5-carboxylate reductase